MLTILNAITLINFLPLIKMGIFQKSKYIFQENYRLVMYDIDIKVALYFSDTCGIL